MAKKAKKAGREPEKTKTRTGLYYARKERGLSQEALAEKVSTTKQTVNRLETGIMELTREWAERFAPHLDFPAVRILFWDLQPGFADTGADARYESPPGNHASTSALLHPLVVGGMGGHTVDLIPIVGVAEAGAWREMPGLDDHEADLPQLAAPRSKLFPTAKHFALEVRGDSMNAAKPTPILDGMIALCIDIASVDLQVESGKIYAVRQTRDGGQTYECTIKRAKVFRDRVELHPESTNANHKPLVIRHDAAEGSTNEVRAIGLVYFAGYDFER